MTIDKPRAEQVPVLRQLWKQAFGDSEKFLDGFFAAGFSEDRCRCLMLDGTLCAALYWFDCRWQEKRLAYLYAVATDEKYRGQGLCRALMEDTHCHLQQLGYHGAALVPGNKQLFALYEKLGYRPFCPMQTVTVQPGDFPAAIRPIAPDCYEALRQDFLPSSSILQTGDTLDFFATYGQFFTGSGTLFCVATEADTLYFQEFLGDAAQLPGILSALKAKKGIVRLPGTDTPFAMYRSLTADNAIPSYLGIALN